MERKRQEDNHDRCRFDKPLNPGWLHLWIIISYEVMLTLCLCIYLNAVKQQITLQKMSPVEEALGWFSAGIQKLKLRRCISLQ